MDLTQAELAARAKLDVKTINRFILGRVSSDSASIKSIADALGQRRSWIEGEDDIRSFQLPKEILSVTVDHDIRTTAMSLRTTPADTAGEAPGEYPAPNPKPIDRRAELPVMKIVKREHAGRKAVGIPKWLDLAAGEGKDLSLCEDLIYFDPKDNFKGLHTAEIRGDSMIKTLLDGDIIVLKPFPAGGVELPALESEDDKTSLVTWHAKHDIREGNICVLSINHEPPTLKRVHYDTRRGPKNWKLQILADNPAAWPMFQADTKDNVVFYAKMVARAEE